MPALKCPACRQRGQTGMPGMPGVVIEVAAGNIPGSTKSLMHCTNCDAAFIRGPFSAGQIVERSLWPL